MIAGTFMYSNQPCSWSLSPPLFEVVPCGSLYHLVFHCAGDAALLEAAKKGILARVQKLVTEENINCRDMMGRNSTPLHLAGRVRNLKSLTQYDHSKFPHTFYNGKCTL